MITTREIVDRLKDIYDRLAAAASFRWGVVVSTTPPLVRLDADTDPVIVGTIVPLAVWSRVLVLLQNRKNTVIGSVGGDPNTIVINGAQYARSGVVAVPSYSLVGGSPLFYQSMVISMPFTPPTGWGFMAAPGKGSTVPSSMMQLNYGETGGMSIMVQSVRGDGLITSLTWTLIKI